MNPFAVVPFLELENGTVIGESVAICKYLEELYPEPSLLGRDARERALIEMWNRRLEIDGLIPMIHAVRNTKPLFAGRVVAGTRTDLAQLPEIAERGIAMLMILLERIDPILKADPFIAGERISIADITGYVMLNAAKVQGVAFAERYSYVARWHADLASRPSAEV